MYQRESDLEQMDFSMRTAAESPEDRHPLLRIGQGDYERDTCNVAGERDNTLWFLGLFIIGWIAALLAFVLN